MKMKVEGTLQVTVDVTLPEAIEVLKEEIIRISTDADLDSPQILGAKVFEADNGEMWVKEIRFNQSFHYPVPEKEQELVKAMKKLIDEYLRYTNQQTLDP